MRARSHFPRARSLVSASGCLSPSGTVSPTVHRYPLFNGQMRIQTAAEQNLKYKAFLGPTLMAAGPLAEGPAGWREIFP